MEAKNIYKSLGLRTGNAVLIGVTGPVRTGKSTFTKRFMEKLVIPNIHDAQTAERAKDELPQSASGRTVMTSEPKFVPEQAVEICPDGVSRLQVRMIDSVGYMIPGVIGAEEDGKPRMVLTPWQDAEMPMAEAAEIGTKKVMEDHCTLGIVVTTDGSITDIPAENYLEAENRAIRDMTATGKPFVVLVNTTQPMGEEALRACKRIWELHGLSAIAVDCQTMEEGEIRGVLSGMLYEFPVKELRFYMPGWVMMLEEEHPVKAALYEAMRRSAEKIEKVSQAEQSLRECMQLDVLSGCLIQDVDLGEGAVSCVLEFPNEMFYEVLSETAGMAVANDRELICLMRSLAQTKKKYDKVAAAMEQVCSTGYGIVMPEAEEMKLEIPQIIKKGSNYAIKLKASAPSIHMIRSKQKKDACILFRCRHLL